MTKATTLDQLVQPYADDGWEVERLDDRTAVVTYHDSWGDKRTVLSLDNYGCTVVLGANYWGSGVTLLDAKRQFQRQGGKLTNGYVILTFPEDSLFLGVDGMGMVSWRGEPPHEHVVQPRGSKKRKT